MFWTIAPGLKRDDLISRRAGPRGAKSYGCIPTVGLGLLGCIPELRSLKPRRATASYTAVKFFFLHLAGFEKDVKQRIRRVAFLRMQPRS